MNDYKLPIIEPTIDYTKVPAINQKRTISFINHFIIHSVTFLNKFALSCEEKLFEFENKLQRVEASLQILESWLSSVPGIEQDVQVKNLQEISKTKKEILEVSLKVEKSENAIEEESKNEDIKGQPVSKDPRYEEYLKLVHLGVPKEVIKLKMMQEGLDSTLLDDPQLLTKPKSADTSENRGD